MIGLLRTLWRFSYQDRHGLAQELACSGPCLWIAIGQTGTPPHSEQIEALQTSPREPERLCTSHSSCSLFCKPSDDDLSEPVISSLTVPPSSLGDAVTLMPPSGTLLLSILVLCRLRYRVHTLICRGSGLPLFFLLSPANSHDAPFAQQVLAWAVRLYQIRPRIVRLDAAYWGLRLIAWIHAVLGAVAVIAWNPKRQKNRSCLPAFLDQRRTRETGVPSSASLDAFFSSFLSNARPCAAGPRWPHRWP